MSLNLLDEMGIEYDSLGSDPGVYQIRLPWTNDEKIDIINTDGEYLPACCGNISCARDILITAFRENSWIRVSDLQQACEYILNCCGESTCLSAPIQQLFQILDAVKDVVSHPDTKRVYKDDYKNSVYMLGQYCQVLSMHELFEKQDESYDKLCKLWSQARLYPALRCVMQTLEENDETLHGFACLINAELVETVGGPAIYPTKAKAKQCVKSWEDFADNDDDAEVVDITIKKVTISMKDGLVFKD